MEKLRAIGPALVAGLVIILAGCGGGGGGSSSSSSTPADPVVAVQAREAAMLQAFAREDIDALMSFYASDWTNLNAGTVADVRATYEQYFPLLDFVDVAGTPTYMVQDNNTLVSVGGQETLRFRVTATGEIQSVVGTGGDVWRKRGDTWLLVFGQSNFALQQAHRLP